MKNYILLIAIIKLFDPELSSAQITFNNTYHNHVDNDFNILSDSLGYIKVMSSYNPPYCQYIFQELNLQGIVVNSKTYGSINEYIFIYSLLRTTDENYAVGSYYRDLLTNIQYVYIAKLNISGDTLWTRKFAANSGFQYIGLYMIETSDSGFLVTGQITDSLVSDADIFIMKTDSSGNLEWTNKFGGSSFDGGYSSIECADSGFLTAGWTRSFGFGNNSNRDDIVIKWDSLGNYQWHETYGTTFNETAIGITKLNDGNYVVASGRNDLILDEPYGKLLKIDINGNIMWQKFQGIGVDSYNWVREMNNFDLVGVSSRNNNGITDGFIVRCDSSGNEKWRRQYRFGNSHCYFRDIQETPDGGIVCAGFVFDGASGGQDGWLVKLDSTGCLSNGCGEPTGLFEPGFSSSFRMSVSPNPVIEDAIVKISGLDQQLLNDNFVVNVFDISGKLVDSPRTGFLIMDSEIQFVIKRGKLESGVYLMEVRSESNLRLGVAKIVIK